MESKLEVAVNRAESVVNKIAGVLIGYGLSQPPSRMSPFETLQYIGRIVTNYLEDPEGEPIPYELDRSGGD